MSDNIKNENNRNNPSCGDDFLGGLFNLMDKIEEKKKAIKKA